MNSLQLLSQHRIPCYTWSGPARSLPIPSSYFASFFSRPPTPYSCPTLYLPKTMNPNNTMLLLRGVTRHPSPFLPRSLAPWSEEVGWEELTATEVRRAQKATYPQGVAPMPAPHPRSLGHRQAPGSQQRLLKPSFQGGSGGTGSCRAGWGKRGDEAGGARTRDPM